MNNIKFFLPPLVFGAYPPTNRQNHREERRWPFVSLIDTVRTSAGHAVWESTNGTCPESNHGGMKGE
jgi:hypothetical protein